MPVTEKKYQSQKQTISVRSDYNENSQIQKQMMSLGISYIQSGIRALELDDSSRTFLTIVDYGSSSGANSSAAMSIIIEGLWEKFGREQMKSIIVYHCDLPSNNWSGLFNYLSCEEASYKNKLANKEGIFSAGVGESFFKQILPNQSLTFGFSCVALHWMSRIPAKIQNHCLPNRATPEELEIFRKQAADDWECFLTARSKELAKGGILVLHVLCGNERGFLLLGDLFYVTLCRLCEDGTIPREEVNNFHIPIFCRHPQDVLDKDQFKRQGFELVRGEECKSPVSYFQDCFAVCKDILAWASHVSKIMSSVLDPFLHQGIFTNFSEAERQQLSSTFFSLYETEILKIHPSELRVDGNVYIVLKKMK